MRFGRLFATSGAGLLNVIFREFYYSTKLVKNSFYYAPVLRLDDVATIHMSPNKFLKRKILQ